MRYSYIKTQKVSTFLLPNFVFFFLCELNLLFQSVSIWDHQRCFPKIWKSLRETKEDNEIKPVHQRLLVTNLPKDSAFCLARLTISQPEKQFMCMISSFKLYMLFIDILILYIFPLRKYFKVSIERKLFMWVSSSSTKLGVRLLLEKILLGYHSC